MDWHKQGYNTALKGASPETGEAYFMRECQDVPVKSAEFRKGFEEGLKKFCTPEFTAQFAASGGVYRGGCCEAEANPTFLEKYRSARVIFLERKVAELESSLAQAESRASSAETEANSLRGTLSSCESQVR